MPPIRIPELLAPAGSFAAALAAFSGGADAVYMGLSDFSARKQARNFTRDEYRRLRHYAQENGKRVYVTLNTLVFEREMEAFAENLVFLSRQGVDAVIVQDSGIMSLLYDRFPGIRIHASTQAAIQTPEAARLIGESYGVKRIVLPRETGVRALTDIASALPDIEFEVFVHGALCYSFSGLCLASGMMLERSGNRGECAQLCRSHYGFKGKEAYWFSCNDLDLSKNISRLLMSGVASLKIEGRMKAPEYSYATARLYRSLLDEAAKGKSLSLPEYTKLHDDALIAFGRTGTAAYFDTHHGVSMIGADYPAHQGIPCAKVRSCADGRLEAMFTRQLRERDGLMLVRKNAENGPVSFSARNLKDSTSAQILKRARAGSLLSMDFAGTADQGDELRMISSRDADLSEPNPLAFDDEAARIPLDFSRTRDETGTFTAHARIVMGDGRLETISVPLPVLDAAEQARTPGAFIQALKVFTERGNRPFVFVPEGIEAACIVTGSGQALPLADAFVPPSLLKKARTDSYGLVSHELGRLDSEYARDCACSAPRVACNFSRFFSGKIPERSFLVYDLGHELPFPFATLAGLQGDIAAHPHDAGIVYVPLAPLARDQVEYLEAALSLARRFAGQVTAGKSPFSRLLFGVNGFHHAAFMARLRKDGLSEEIIGCFLDIFAYSSSTHAVVAWSMLSGGATFAYYSMEAGSTGIQDLRARLAAVACDENAVLAVDAAFKAPLFSSMACFKLHQGSSPEDYSPADCCPQDFRSCADCDRQAVYQLEDSSHRYLCIVQDCVSYTFLWP